MELLLVREDEVYGETKIMFEGDLSRIQMMLEFIEKGYTAKCNILRVL